LTNEKIIDLFSERSEQAIKELSLKYGSLCKNIAFNILHNKCDAEECESDTYLKVWNTIPPQKPQCLIAYVSKIARNISLNSLKYYNQKKRNADIDTLFSELCECIPSNKNLAQITEDIIISKAINEFLRALDNQTRVLFVQRYFYMETAESLSKRFGLSASNVSTKLNRTRTRMKSYLSKKGISI